MSEQLLDLYGRSPDAVEVATAIDEDLASPLARHRRLRPLLLYLLNHLSERLSAAQAARIVSVERKYFSKFFRRETGFTFARWNREVRIRRATQLLHQGGCKIDSIAFAVGYVDLTTFARAFKKCTGTAPQAYRRSRYPPRIAQRDGVRSTAEVMESPGLYVTKNADKKTTNADCIPEADADAK